jgi:hypothetical protein
VTIKVPLKSLRLPGIYPGMVGEGEEEKEVLPEKGDPVSFSVEGVVTGVTGDMGDVEVRFINGERPSAHDAGEKKETKSEEPNDEADLAKLAEEADAEEP